MTSILIKDQNVPERPTHVLSHLGSQESIQMWVEGEDGVVGDSLQELVQSFHPRLHELLWKTVDHALHHKLLWQRLDTRGEVEKEEEEREEW